MDFEVDSGQRRSWREVDRQLRSVARRRAALDAEEAACLREAEALRIWRSAGCVSMHDYLERVVGYSPRAATERLRIARLLGSLPALSRALADGVVAHSAVRELVRVATPATEGVWLAAVEGKNLREIEELVAGHGTGDLPDDPADPDLRPRTIQLELCAETFALFRETRKALETECGKSLSDDELVDEMCRRALDGGGESNRPSHQIAVTTCDRCKRGWQDGGGSVIEIGPAALERALCDAEYLGSVEAEQPARATSDITPAVRRLVKRREHGGCIVPGCRSTRNLDLHHIVPRAAGGGHDPSNLVLCCAGDHANLHRGLLTITGVAPDQLTFTRHRMPDRGDDAIEAEAEAVLVGAGYEPAAAAKAVREAMTHVGRTTLEDLLPEAFRRVLPTRYRS